MCNWNGPEWSVFEQGYDPSLLFYSGLRQAFKSSCLGMCSSYGCFSWQTWVCNTAPPLWSLSAVPARELLCKQAVILVSKQGCFTTCSFYNRISTSGEDTELLRFFHQTVHQFYKNYGLLGFLWHLQNIYCIRKSCVLLDPHLKYPAISLADAFVSDAGTYPRAKVCVQFSLWRLGAQTCVERVISATVYIQFIIYFFPQNVDGSGSFTISP